jgi:hypothetical protein
MLRTAVHGAKDDDSDEDSRSSGTEGFDIVSAAATAAAALKQNRTRDVVKNTAGGSESSRSGSRGPASTRNDRRSSRGSLSSSPEDRQVTRLNK